MRIVVRRAVLAALSVSIVVIATPLGPPVTERAPASGLVVHGPVTTGQEEQIGRRIDGVGGVYGRAEAVTLGIRVSADPGSGPFRTTRLRNGRFPLGPGEIALTPRTADRLGLTIGSTFHGETVTGMVTGREDTGRQAYAAQTTVTALRGDDRLDRIDVRVRPGFDPDGVRRQIEALLGPQSSVSAIPGGSW
jgi:putative ABC transport system permease protein